MKTSQEPQNKYFLSELANSKILSIVKAYGLGFLITVILSDLLDEVVKRGVL